MSTCSFALRAMVELREGKVRNPEMGQVNKCDSHLVPDQGLADGHCQATVYHILGLRKSRISSSIS